MRASTNWGRRMVAGAALAMLAGAGPAAANDPGHRTLSGISFVNATPRVSQLVFSPFGSGLLRSAVEPGLEGWFKAAAQGLGLAMRYHLIGLGRLVRAGYIVTDTGALNVGYRFQHISNGHTSNPNRGFNSDSGVGGVSFHFK
jgi:hypothetical protein